MHCVKFVWCLKKISSFFFVFTVLFFVYFCPHQKYDLHNKQIKLELKLLHQ